MLENKKRKILALFFSTFLFLFINFYNLSFGFDLNDIIEKSTKVDSNFKKDNLEYFFDNIYKNRLKDLNLFEIIKFDPNFLNQYNINQLKVIKEENLFFLDSRIEDKIDSLINKKFGFLKYSTFLNIKTKILNKILNKIDQIIEEKKEKRIGQNIFLLEDLKKYFEIKKDIYDKYLKYLELKNLNKKNNFFNKEEINYKKNKSEEKQNIKIDGQELKRLLNMKKYPGYYFKEGIHYSVKLNKIFTIGKKITNYIYKVPQNLYIMLNKFYFIETKNLQQGLDYINKTWKNYYKIGILKEDGFYRIFIIPSKENLITFYPFNLEQPYNSKTNLKIIEQRGIHYINKNNIIVSDLNTSITKIKGSFIKIKLPKFILFKKKNNIYFQVATSGTNFYIFDKQSSDFKEQFFSLLMTLPVNSFIFDYDPRYLIVAKYKGINYIDSPIKVFYLGTEKLYKNFTKGDFDLLEKILSGTFYNFTIYNKITYNPKDLFQIYYDLLKFNNLKDFYNWIVTNFKYDKKIEILTNKQNIGQEKLEKEILKYPELYLVWNLFYAYKHKVGVCASLSELLALWGLVHGYNTSLVVGTFDNYLHMIVKIGEFYYDLTGEISIYNTIHKNKFEFFAKDLNFIKTYLKNIEYIK